MRTQDLSGKRFGRLVALRVEATKPVRWLCHCDCGKETLVEASNLPNGHTQSCGCLQKERVSQASKRHGLTGTQVYRVWLNMHRRCDSISHDKFRYYGGRGIHVCARWGKFENFLSDMGKPSARNRTFSRIDHDGDYTPDNCRWVTWDYQRRHQRKTKFWNGKTANQWSALTGIPASTIRKRLHKGWTLSQALEKSQRPR